MNVELTAPNLEQDIKQSKDIQRKITGSNVYAQNLYAALCNNVFQKIELWPILKNETWSCSWRYAGGLIADIRGEGTYLDWYCTGIDLISVDDAVGEGCITKEITRDLKLIGWAAISPKENL